jgi:hypothetical protein
LRLGDNLENNNQWDGTYGIFRATTQMEEQQVNIQLRVVMGKAGLTLHLMTILVQVVLISWPYNQVERGGGMMYFLMLPYTDV